MKNKKKMKWNSFAQSIKYSIEKKNDAYGMNIHVIALINLMIKLGAVPKWKCAEQLAAE